MPKPLVCAERFSFRYAEAAGPSLREIDLSLEPGSFTVLAGVSGSGKSTLLRALCGLVPHFHEPETPASTVKLPGSRLRSISRRLGSAASA